MDRSLDSALEEIKARVDLADLVASYGIAVKHAGTTAKACCPFHNEKTPSFHINLTKGFYHCFGCGESGDAIKFVQKQEGLSFMEAVRKLGEQCGVKIEDVKPDKEKGKRTRLYALMAELAQFYHRCLGKMKAAEAARQYLVKRDLDEKVQEDFVIGYAPEGVGTIVKWAEKYGYTMEELEAAGVVKAPNRPGDLGYHRFGGRLMFTIKDRQGRVVAFSGRQIVEKKNSGKYVNSPETLIFKKSKVLFGFDRAAANIAKAPHREAIVCEGQIDTIRLHVCGFPVAVASQGTAFTEEHAKMLKKVADAVVLVFDDDAAGHKATVRTAALMLAESMPVRVVSLPGGHDPDSFLREKGHDAFQALLDGAESIVSFQVRVMQGKEVSPKSVDALARVSRGVLGTIASAPSAVLRAGMVDEAAHLLGLPVAALQEELKGTKPAAELTKVAKVEKSAAVNEDEVADEFDAVGDEDEVIDEELAAGEDAAKVVPPSGREFELMDFLFIHERDEVLGKMVEEFLPREILGHDFTRGFVEAWKSEFESEEDRVVAFAEGLEGVEKGWFDRVMRGSDRKEACSQTPTEVLQGFVRGLWIDYMKRKLGGLPAVGDKAVDAERFELATQSKCLSFIKWHDVKDVIQQQKILLRKD